MYKAVAWPHKNASRLSLKPSVVSVHAHNIYYVSDRDDMNLFIYHLFVNINSLISMHSRKKHFFMFVWFSGCWVFFIVFVGIRNVKNKLLRRICQKLPFLNDHFSIQVHFIIWFQIATASRLRFESLRHSNRVRRH